MSLETVLTTYLTEPCSLDAPVSSDDSRSLVDFLVGPRCLEPDVAITARSEYEPVRKALAKLGDKERMVLLLRFGIWDNEERTFEQIGRIIGVTKERVRQIEKVAILRLRTFFKTGKMPRVTFMDNKAIILAARPHGKLVPIMVVR